MPKKGGRRRKSRTHVKDDEEQKRKIPKSFVLKIGNVGQSVKDLKADFKKVMLPNTAFKLKERKSNSMKDFLHIAGPLGVSHFAVFSSTEFGTYLRLGKVPRGPTLTFRVHKYTLMRDIATLLPNPHSNSGKEYNIAPLVVLNNFPTKEEHYKLASIMWQGMFPPLNIQTLQVGECKRVVLLNYDKDTKTIEFRHYYVKTTAVGVAKGIKKLLRRQIPNLDKFGDIADYVLGNDEASDSEREDGPDNRFEMPQKGSKTGQQSAVRLVELGPRLSLQLIKVEEEFFAGDVMFHEYVKKSPEEIALLKQKKKERDLLKKQRKAEQERNVKRKKEGKGKKEEDGQGEERSDEEWYREEVGQAPDPMELAAPTRVREKYNPIYRRKQTNEGDEEENDEPKDEKQEKKVRFESSKKRKADEVQSFDKGKNSKPKFSTKKKMKLKK